jgi:chromosome segregation ATPase
MWLDKIIEAKETNKLSTKMMSEKTSSHIPPETITRILARKTKTPRIDTILELGEAVGLSASELFAETTAVLVDGNLSALQAENEAVKAESAALRAEVELLRSERDANAAEILILKEKLEAHRDKVDTLKDEIINTHNNYHRLIANLTK